MRICYLTSNIDAAGCYRCLFPGRELRRQFGWRTGMATHRIQQGTCDGRPHLLIEFLLDQLPDADVYVLQQPLDKAYLGLIDYLHSEGRRVVFETDDLFVGIPPYNPAFAGTDPATHPDRNRDVLHECMRAADLVTVSTKHLAEVYDSYNDVVVVPNFLDEEMWVDVVPAFEQERRRVRVGWMGDSRWRRGDLAVLRGVIGPWLRRNPDVEFVASGDPLVLDLLDVPNGQRVAVQGVDFHHMELADITAVMDVGLAPLELNSFNEAKSCLKGMEYGICGVPCVASPSQEYLRWCDDECGLTAKRPNDWVRCLDLLVRDDGVRRRMGKLAREKALSLTIQRRVGEWKQAFETAMYSSSKLTASTV